MRHLIGEYLTLLDIGPSQSDPIFERLYPSASPEDDVVASSYRDLTLTDLESLKRANAATALTSLGESGGWRGPVSPDQQDAWLALLTDLRLIIGVRHGVTEETMDLPLDSSSPSHLFILHYLGTLQEELVGAIRAAQR